MTFLEQRLNTQITTGAVVSITNPGRIKVYTESGRLTQRFTASAPKHIVELSHGVRTADDFHTVRDLWFVVHFAPYSGFRVKIHNDHTATQQNSTATFQPASSTVLQLQRAHVFGGMMFKRNIYKPVASTVTVYRTRSGIPGAIASTVDYTTGLATISGHLAGDTYTWEGEFDIPMTFFDNEWSASLEIGAPNVVLTAQSIKLEEILL
jgi:uncharacterized protein (TIGR02217 family)